MLAGMWLVIGGYLVVSVIRGLLSNAVSPDGATTFLWAGLFLTIATLVIWMALSLLKQSYIITTHGIEVNRLQGKKSLPWSYVKTLMAIPTFAGVSGYKLFLQDGTNITLQLAFMAHYERSAQALIEAARIGNPDIKFDFVFGNEFGEPPYGIFKNNSPLKENFSASRKSPE